MVLGIVIIEVIVEVLQISIEAVIFKIEQRSFCRWEHMGDVLEFEISVEVIVENSTLQLTHSVWTMSTPTNIQHLELIRLFVVIEGKLTDGWTSCTDGMSRRHCVQKIHRRRSKFIVRLSRCFSCPSRWWWESRTMRNGARLGQGRRRLEWSLYLKNLWFHSTLISICEKGTYIERDICRVLEQNWWRNGGGESWIFQFEVTEHLTQKRITWQIMKLCYQL